MTSHRMTPANPILRGFNPDPSIVRVGDDYYIATSTFEWFPGVQIHHSRNLTDWQLSGRPLSRPAQLDMRGDPDSCGVWAPDISYKDGRFHLIYTDVKRYGRTTVDGAKGASLRDFHNYWVWSDRIDGDWSDPVHLNSSGFDPALFHDDDGRSWLLNMLWDHRPDRQRFAGIVAQEMDLAAGRLIGDRRMIFEGTALGFTEGPHLYKSDGWYHLLVAEGGTGRGHAVVMARSRNLFGPYAVHPDGPVLTARDSPDAPLQRLGHGDLVETADGQTWMAYLCGRPLPDSDRCVLGRETAIRPMRWDDDGWLRSAEPLADTVVETPVRALDVFDLPVLPQSFQWLRTPYPDYLFSLTERPGHLRLFGRETIGSHFHQALVARRPQAFRYDVRTLMDFDPEHFQQAAGLICYYNSSKYLFLHVTAGDAGERQLQILSVLPIGEGQSTLTSPVALPPGPIELRASVDRERLNFGFRAMGAADWRWLPETFDASLLSDEATLPGLPNFTGTFVGMACQDLAGTARPADFRFFQYVEDGAA
ncbi:xylan 1,4-beta-xylosidase [Sphingomonas sp. PP-CE-3A-406]|uniref:glycoside hydrolase family 43 protein n=1 Tax=Sphingomonas sp. PP-CE-3A-406 TaxID=2135659 RepID=UPI000F16B3CD|nr:glycoside hydrolase family 43 protein [Sphingomonas sp. PP-CE-3A-406]RMB55545.1 xylan 1,4-beta-xylosidase [Sphingomonas sp. PP-CE-3A-406]